jgi:c-di-GMP-binding flagellar brake protein YcgR
MLDWSKVTQIQVRTAHGEQRFTAESGFTVIGDNAAAFDSQDTAMLRGVKAYDKAYGSAPQVGKIDVSDNQSNPGALQTGRLGWFRRANTKKDIQKDFIAGNREPIERKVLFRGRNLPELPHNEFASLIFHTVTGDRYRFTAYVNLSTATQLNVTLNPDSETLLPERRRFVKVRTYKPAVIIRQVQSDGKVNDFIPGYSAKIEDINVGGVKLSAVTGEPFEIKDMLKIDVPDFNGKKREFTLEVLRLDREEDSGKVTAYGCRFVGLRSTDETEVARFVHHEQAEALRKLREKNQLD